MIEKISPRWPAALLPLRHWAGLNLRRARRSYEGLWDRRIIQRRGLRMIPPARLRDRVHGVPDIERFLSSGRRAKERIEKALGGLRRPPASFDRILDFGCGSGRILRWMEPYAATCELHGSDVDREAIEWCAAQIPFARFHQNQALPPLAHADASFDLIYAVSVLTHLDEAAQFAWLEELRRVLRPSGLLLLSVHGEGARGALDPLQLAQLDARGFLYVRTDRWRGTFADWYQVAFHTPEYVQAQFGKIFEIVQYLPEGLSRHQDFVALRRRSGN